MSDGTGIQWCDATLNPFRARIADGAIGTAEPELRDQRGWACVKVSPGCSNCYAERVNHRLGTGLPYTVTGMAESAVYLDEKALTQPLRWKRGRRIFLSSMTDVFGEWVTDEQLDRLFAVMALSPQHTYQVLTKRAERMREYASDVANRLGWKGEALGWPGVALGELRGSEVWRRAYMAASESERAKDPDPEWYHENGEFVARWPLPNVWLGVSVEDQKRADERIPLLLQTPAAVRFLSCEPLLGPVVLCTCVDEPAETCCLHGRECYRLSWVIVGGEPGPGARPMDIAWARSLVAQCKAAGTACFVKQLGANPVTACKSHGVSCGGHKWPWNENEAQARGKEPRPKIKDRKGGEISEWPEDLRVRQFPS